MSLPRELAARAAITLAILAALHFAHRLPSPFLGDDSQLPAAARARLGAVDPLALGLAPFLLGAAAVELLAHRLPPGRRLRREGLYGRRQIDRLAVRAGFLVAVVQAMIRLRRLEAWVPTDLVFRLVVGATWVAGAAAVLGLAQLVTRFGIGNGIAWLLAGEGWALVLGSPERASSPSPLFLVPLGALVMGPWLARRPSLDRQRLRLAALAPFHPRGFLPLVLAAGLSAVAATSLHGSPLSFWQDARIFGAAACVAALALDLGGEVRFRLRTPASTVPLVAFDDVALGRALAHRLAGAGVPAHLRGAGLRSLFLVFLPSVKAELLIPISAFGRAREVFKPELLKVI